MKYSLKAHAIRIYELLKNARALSKVQVLLNEQIELEMAQELRIVTLVPSRGRPKAALALKVAFKETKAKSKLYFLVDEDDPYRYEYLNLLGIDSVLITPSNGERGVVFPLNYWSIKVKSKYDILIYMGDDHRPRTQQWDLYLAATTLMGYQIAYGNDLLRGKELPTAAAISKSILTVFGYVAPKSIKHLFIDDLWLKIGTDLNRIAYLPEVIIEHLHFSNGKSNKDSLYEINNSRERFESDKLAYIAFIKSDEYRKKLSILKKNSTP